MTYQFIKSTAQGIQTAITRENIDAHLDAGRIFALMQNGKWWQLRRNGATKRWARDPLRLRIPYKMGFHGTGQITEADFAPAPNGALYGDCFRLECDLTNGKSETE